MKWILIIGIVLFILPITYAIEFDEVPEITIVFNQDGTNNINGDDNIFHVWCVNTPCHVYYTQSVHTILTGD